MMGKTAIALGAGAGALVLVGIGLAVSKSTSAAGGSTPAAPPLAGGGTWHLVQGHRYLVTLRAQKPADWTKANYGALPSTLSFAAHVSSSPQTLSYEVDSLSSDHDEPDASFFVGLDPQSVGGLDLVVTDLGALPSASGTRSTGPNVSTPAPGTAMRTWQPATSVAVGDRLRFTLSPDGLIAYLTAAVGAAGAAQAKTSAATAMALLQEALGGAQSGSRLKTHLYYVWGPGKALPDDWPADDPNLSDGYHVELVYGVEYLGSALASPSTFPTGIPTLAASDLKVLGLSPAGMWAATGPLPSSSTGLPRPQISWTPATKLSPGDHVRLTTQKTWSDQPALAKFGDAARLAFLTSIDTALKSIGTVGIAWMPGGALPPDWPSDDTAALTGYHFEANWPIALDLSTNRLTRAWVASGAGA